MTSTSGGIGPLLRAARLARGWSHEDVAHRIDASLGSYSRWERGKNTPQGHNLQQLIEVFELDAAEAMAAVGAAMSPGLQAENAERHAFLAGLRIVELEERVAALEARASADHAQLTATVNSIVADHLSKITGGMAPEPRDADGSTWVASRAVQDAVKGARPGARKGSSGKG